MAKFEPYKILESQLENLPIVAGQFIITTDTNKIYVDIDDTTRKEYGTDNNNFVFYKVDIDMNNLGEIKNSNIISLFQKIVNEHNKGKDVIITADTSMTVNEGSYDYFFLPSTAHVTSSQNYYELRSSQITIPYQSNNSESELKPVEYKIKIQLNDEGKVSGVFLDANLNMSFGSGGRFLATNVNYTTPYEPKYDGSPATKAYVDKNLPLIYYFDNSGTEAGGDTITDETTLAFFNKIYEKTQEGKTAILILAEGCVSGYDYDGNDPEITTTRPLFVLNNKNFKNVDGTVTILSASPGLYCTHNSDGSSTTETDNTAILFTFNEAGKIDGFVWGEATNNSSMSYLSVGGGTDTKYFIPTKKSQPTSKGYVDDAITSALANITGLTPEIVTELPTTGDSNKIYLILKENTEENSNDIYDEFLWINNKYEHIGSTDMNVDLTPYATKEWVKDEMPKIYHIVSFSNMTNEQKITLFGNVINDHNNNKDVLLIFMDKIGIQTKNVMFFSFPKDLAIDNQNAFILISTPLMALTRDNSNTNLETNSKALSIFLSEAHDTVTEVILTSSSNSSIKVLETNRNYATPYTPQYPGSPATKKYVDDAVLKKGNASFYYWDGKSSTDNAENLTLWQEILTRGQTEEIIVVVGGDMTFTNFIRIAPDTATVHSTGTKSILGTSYQPTSNKTSKTKGTDLLMQGLKVTLNISSVDPLTISSVSAIGTNNISMGHFLPTDEGRNYTFTPTEDGQPATKKYVDDSIAAAGSTNDLAVFSWDGKSTTDNPDNLEFWQNIVNLVKNDGKTALIYCSPTKSNFDNGIYVFGPSFFEGNNYATTTLVGFANGTQTNLIGGTSEVDFTVKKTKVVITYTSDGSNGGIVVSVSGYQSQNQSSHSFLTTNVTTNNSNEDLAYIPTKPGQPASKKYTDETVERSGIFYWNGKSSTDDPEVLELWKKIINKVKTEQKGVLVYSNKLTSNSRFYNSVFVVSPANTFENTLYLYGLANYFSQTTVSNSCARTATLYQSQVKLYFTGEELTKVDGLFYTSSGLNNYLTTENTADNQNEAKAFIPTFPGHPVSKGYLDQIVGNIDIILDNINGEVINGNE